MNRMTIESWCHHQAAISARRERVANRIAIAIFTLAALVLIVAWLDAPAAPGCETDTECAALCDPADKGCDGGR